MELNIIKMEENMKENLKIIKEMAMVYYIGQMEQYLKAIIKMTIKMGKE